MFTSLHRIASGRAVTGLQPSQFRLQGSDFPVFDRQGHGYIGGLQQLRAVKWAIGIQGVDGERDDLLCPRLVPRWHQARSQGGISRYHPPRAPDLDALAVRMVDQEQMRQPALPEETGLRRAGRRSSIWR